MTAIRALAPRRLAEQRRRPGRSPSDRSRGSARSARPPAETARARRAPVGLVGEPQQRLVVGDAAVAQRARSAGSAARTARRRARGAGARATGRRCSPAGEQKPSLSTRPSTRARMAAAPSRGAPAAGAEVASGVVELSIAAECLRRHAGLTCLPAPLQGVPCRVRLKRAVLSCAWAGRRSPGTVGSITSSERSTRGARISFRALRVRHPEVRWRPKPPTVRTDRAVHFEPLRLSRLRSMRRRLTEVGWLSGFVRQLGDQGVDPRLELNTSSPPVLSATALPCVDNRDRCVRQDVRVLQRSPGGPPTPSTVTISRISFTRFPRLCCRCRSRCFQGRV